MFEKNTLFGSKIFRQQQQLTSSLTSRPVYQSKSLSNIQELNRSQNYFRFEVKCGNASFVYEKNINRGSESN